MTRVVMCVLLGVGVAAVSLPGQAVPSYTQVRGALAFDGHGTLGDFTGQTTELQGVLTGAPTIEGVRGWVTTQVATLTTGNGRRDRDMRSSLEVEKFPELRFVLEGVGVGPRVGDSTSVTLRGRFTIHGVTRESAIRGWVTIRAGEVHIRGATPMTLTDYDIGGLSKALGLLKMNPEIVVRMDLVFGEPSTENREQN